ncbi:hypothetical protein QDY72_01170 [Kingella negevensis]|uniref:Uncharacterized protein n=1 Tax=Kingella negevensis TaxID=1522312 RepID=A0A238TAP6_9NEIS|nr:hypothetical protein [Kingella negevensis]MDK4679285.1 hypothetical protein [Kingella negevensis]MDK4682993.1 hypothetical protein [Kingella negevensis]MDK4683813.1 hypothetical protein [Kingella negevensis]MDK4691193.1 hypothetical protein [Kingella negevensis]MDK4693659.1 hypothetical protein [Kingella negevensis]
MKNILTTLLSTLIWCGITYVLNELNFILALAFIIFSLFAYAIKCWRKRIGFVQAILPLSLPIAFCLLGYGWITLQNSQRQQYVEQNMIKPVQQFYAQHQRYPRKDEMPKPNQSEDNFSVYAYNRNNESATIETAQYRDAKRIDCFYEYSFQQKHWQTYCW